MKYLGQSESGATFSQCRQYRWTLWRRWDRMFGEPHDGERLIAFIGLNPSTATESVNDPTITRLIRFAQRWDYDGMAMLNLFAFRATDPKDMKIHPSPIGEENDAAILEITKFAALTVCCWGVHGVHLDRSSQVRQLLSERNLSHFGLTADGEPKHPLYLPNATALHEWNARHEDRKV